MQLIDIQRLHIRPLPESDFKPVRGFIRFRAHDRGCSARPAKRGANFCRVEQLVARVAHNHKVAGSSPAPATTSSGHVARSRRARQQALGFSRAWRFLFPIHGRVRGFFGGQDHEID